MGEGVIKIYRGGGGGSRVINKSVVELSRLCLYPFPTLAAAAAALHIQSFAVCLIYQGMYISQVRV